MYYGLPASLRSLLAVINNVKSTKVASASIDHTWLPHTATTQIVRRFYTTVNKQNDQISVFLSNRKLNVHVHYTVRRTVHIKGVVLQFAYSSDEVVNRVCRKTRRCCWLLPLAATAATATAFSHLYAYTLYNMWLESASWGSGICLFAVRPTEVNNQPSLAAINVVCIHATTRTSNDVEGGHETAQLKRQSWLVIHGSIKCRSEKELFHSFLCFDSCSNRFQVK